METNEIKLNYLSYLVDRWQREGFLTLAEGREIYYEVVAGLSEDDSWPETIYLEEEGRQWAEGMGHG